MVYLVASQELSQIHFVIRVRYIFPGSASQSFRFLTISRQTFFSCTGSQQHNTTGSRFIIIFRHFDAVHITVYGRKHSTPQLLSMTFIEYSLSCNCIRALHCSSSRHMKLRKLPDRDSCWIFTFELSIRKVPHKFFSELFHYLSFSRIEDNRKTPNPQ